MFFAADDVQVSSSGTFTNDIEFTLRADLNEMDEVRLYLLADNGYTCSGTTVIPSGSTAAKWAFAPDNTGSPGTYNASGSGIGFTTVIINDTDKTYFWARAKATSDESPVNDTNVILGVAGIAAAE